MKQLIIGIDGGSDYILQKMPMPYTLRLFENSKKLNLTEDLLSRGWAEIMSGLYARDTKALYVHPALDGTHDCVLRYSLKELLSNPEVTPIWDIPAKRGKVVGIMNIPTTFPAPQINGFFVSGAGGGVNKVNGIPSELCHPEGIVQTLNDLGYIVDIRMGTAGIKDIQILFDKLNHMLERRITAFLELCNQHAPDFGFLAIRATTVIQYLAMSEIDAYFRYKGGQLSSQEINQHAIWFENLEKHYALLDISFKRLFEALNPQNYIITSDHSIVPYKLKSNPNVLLRRIGFQEKELSILKTIKKLLKSILMQQAFFKVYHINWSRTLAFSDWYVSAIYINDAERFDGPVTKNQIDRTVDQLCRAFNATDEATKFQMTAKPYRRLHPQAKYNQYLPDIKIHCSDSIFLLRSGESFVWPNEGWSALRNLNNVQGGMHSGQKGRHPLFYCDNSLSELIMDDDPRDLTLVYKLTQRLYR